MKMSKNILSRFTGTAEFTFAFLILLLLSSGSTTPVLADNSQSDLRNTKVAENSAHGSAQKAEENAFIKNVLADAEQDLGTLALHTRNTLKPLVEIGAGHEYQVVAQLGNRSVIRFTQPSVPIWVNKRFVEVTQGHARIAENSVKLRSNADDRAFYIGLVERGYQSPVLNSNNGFVQILAPPHIEYSLFDQGTSVVPEEPQEGWRTPSEKPAVVRQASKLTKRPLVDAGVNKVLVSSDQNNRLTERQHVLSPGDSISLRVFGEPDLSVESVRIPSSGKVSFALIGSLVVAGKTTAELETLIADRLGQGYVKNPKLSVTIFSYRPIFVRGAVNNIGAFPYAEGLSVASAIALAGGPKNSALANGVSIVRDGATIASTLSIDSLDLIRSGDVINVAEEQGVPDEQAFYVYLHGEVTNPGEYKFRKGLTVEKAVVLAGGFTLRASRRKITVTRHEDSAEPEKLKRVKLHAPIKPGDIIDVGASWF